MTTRPIDADGSYYKKAHAKFLEGARDQNPASKTALKESIDALTEAVTMTNNKYARAMSELAYMKIVASESGLFSASETIGWLRDAVELSDEAVQLQDHDYITHWVKGFVLCNTGSNVDFKLGLDSWRIANDRFKDQTDPSDRRSGFRIEYAEQLALAERHEEAECHVDAALRIPDWFRWIAAFVYQHNRERLKEALEQIDLIQKPDELMEVYSLRASILEKMLDDPGPDDNVNELAKASIESMKKYAEAGKKFLDSERANGREVEEHHLEKIFLKEFNDSGYLNDGKTEGSLEWRKYLARAYKRSSTQLVATLDTQYMEANVALVSAMEL